MVSEPSFVSFFENMIFLKAKVSASQIKPMDFTTFTNMNTFVQETP
jgi:hypothetical protein